MPQNARHAAPRAPVARRALLPTVLLLAATGAFGGLAVLPRPADAHTQADASPASAGGSRPGEGSRPLRAMSLSDVVTAEQERIRNRVATQAAAALRTRERASRNRVRPPAPEPAVKAPPPKPAPPSHVRPGVGALTSQYGPRWGRLHAGIDLASGVGSPISAVAAGTVLSAGDEGGYGLCVRVQHPNGTVSLYAHLSAIVVRKGQVVRAGTHLGREGNSGNSTGPHLHFEVRVGGTPVDPAAWLKARGVDPARP